MDLSHARITVERTSPDDVQQRQVVLSLDGQPLGTLLYTESVTHAIEPGHHRLRAHNTLVWKTVEFDCATGEHVRFVTVNRAGFGSAALVALLGAGPLYVTLERLTGDDSSA
ncbi:MAG: hypothetical protein ABI818_20800 [Acidobacteriota bacterium]